MIKVLRRILAIFIGLVIVGFGILFSLQNQTVIAVDLLFPETFQHSIAFWVLGSFAAGVIVAMLVFSLLMLRLQQQVFRSKLKIKSLQKQLADIEVKNRQS